MTLTTTPQAVQVLMEQFHYAAQRMPVIDAWKAGLQAAIPHLVDDAPDPWVTSQPTEYEMWRDALQIAATCRPLGYSAPGEVVEAARSFLAALKAGAPQPPEPTPPEPPAGTRVRDSAGDEWYRVTDGWVLTIGLRSDRPVLWADLLDHCGPITVPLDHPQAGEQA